MNLNLTENNSEEVEEVEEEDILEIVNNSIKKERKGHLLLMLSNKQNLGGLKLFNIKSIIDL